VRDEASLAGVVVAADIAHPVEPLHPDMDLLEAMRRMGTRGVSALPVTDPRTGRLAGMLDRGHLLAAYERAMARQGESGPDASG
jgi:CBS domain-containing protein